MKHPLQAALALAACATIPLATPGPLGRQNPFASSCPTRQAALPTLIILEKAVGMSGVL